MIGETPTASGWLKRPWSIAGIIGCAVIACSAGLAYHNSIRAPFVFDDLSSIVENGTIRKLWPLGPVLVPPAEGTTVSGRPFLNLSFAINYSVGQLRVVGYHVLNVVIHILSGMTLFGILRRTLPVALPQSAAVKPGSGRTRVFGLSLLSALIWTVHPMQTESVTYVAQRAESLMGVLYLLTLYCFMRGTGLGDLKEGAESQPRARSGVWYGLAIAACALGMATKEVMATAPLMVLLFDRTYLSGGFRPALRQRGVVYLGLAASWIELFYLVMSGGSRGGTAGFGTGVKWTSYALQQIEAVVQYLRLSFWPNPLVFDYGHNLAEPGSELQIQAILLLGLAVATASGVWRRTSLGFLGAWFFIILAPSSSVVPVATEVMAEHRMYLPLAAVTVLTVVLGERVLRNLSWIVFAALIVALGFATSRRNDAYRTRLTLWSDTVEKAPANPGAHNNFGTALMDSGDLVRAIGQFTEALRLDPTFLGAKSNLGLALLKAGRLDEAVDCFRDIVRSLPDFVEGRRNLAMALARDGRPTEAIAEFDKVLLSRPGDSDARRRLASALLDAGRTGEAIPEFEQVIQSWPDNVEAQASLGDALLETGHAQDAVAHYEKAVSLMPGFVDAQVNLGSALFLAGHPDEAIGAFKAALQLQPENLRAVRNLAVALRSAGRLEEAQRELEWAAHVEAKDK